jgi:uncharacterized protein YcgL (UPF0745 family)
VTVEVGAVYRSVRERMTYLLVEETAGRPW